MVDICAGDVVRGDRVDGVLECGGVGGGLCCLVVAGVVVRECVEAVVPVDRLFGRVLRHLVVEGAAAVAVGMRQRERAVAGLLDVELDAGDAGAGGGVGGVRVDGDRSGVVEL